MRTIVVKPSDDGYQAHVEGQPGRWEYGGNQYIAVTKLCHSLWCDEGNKVIWHEPCPAPAVKPGQGPAQSG